MATPSYLAWLVAALLVPCVDPQVTSTPVNTSAGRVLGKMSTVLVDDHQVQVETFWGIPYAKPPVEDLRFKKTEPVEPWTGVRNARNPPKACMQKIDNVVITSADQMSEDCLYLNIWRPYCNQTNMATLVWIHGGSLKSGSSADPSYMGDILAATECVIVASVNYRLGVFGFLYTTFPGHRGNAGLHDVLSALRFLNRNIGLFGGNNSTITLFGGGAGAYIVSTFLMSTLGRDLFRNAILQSGNPLMQMMFQGQAPALTAAAEVSNRVGCFNITVNLSCLKNVTSTSLLEAFHATTRTMRFNMVSTVDGEFLTMNPTAYLESKSVKNCSILVGTNKDEGTESLIKILPAEFNTSNPEPPVFTEKKLGYTLRRFLGMLYKDVYLHHISTVVKLIYNYKRLERETTNPSLHFLSNICTDLAYRCPQQALIDTYTQLGNKVYVYSFDRAPNNTDLPAWVGATHRSEIPYIFRSEYSIQAENLVDEEFALSNTMMKLWADFARHGNPTPQGQLTPKWKCDPHIMHFTERATMMSTKNHLHACLYWNSMPAQMRI